MRFAPFTRQRHHITYLFSYAARQRMQNRARLLKQYQTHLKKQASYIVEGNAKSRRALRQHNREQINSIQNGFLRRSRRTTDAGRRWRKTIISSAATTCITSPKWRFTAWNSNLASLMSGGTRPDKGFDCSGLVFYAYNKILEAKLRARPMRCTTTVGQRLWRITTCAGEICCFSISTAVR